MNTDSYVMVFNLLHSRLLTLLVIVFIFDFDLRLTLIPIISLFFFFFFFFFSSRRRHTRLTCDWSSDVCSSDLDRHFSHRLVREFLEVRIGIEPAAAALAATNATDEDKELLKQKLERMRDANEGHFDPVSADIEFHRSEERRVGKECRSRWWPSH